MLEQRKKLDDLIKQTDIKQLDHIAELKKSLRESSDNKTSDQDK